MDNPPSPFAARAALIVIDLQNGFCEPTGSVGRQGRSLDSSIDASEKALGLAKAFQCANVPVIWTQYEIRSDYADSGRAIRTLRPGMRQNKALAAGSWDAEFWRPEAIAETDFVIKKSRMSAVLGTPLELILHDLDAQTVYVCGLTTSMCVESTVRDLAQRDYDVRVITDATGDYAAERHTASLSAMEFGFARIVTAEDAAQEMKINSDYLVS